MYENDKENSVLSWHSCARDKDKLPLFFIAFFAPMYVAARKYE